MPPRNSSATTVQRTVPNIVMFFAPTLPGRMFFAATSSGGRSLHRTAGVAHQHLGLCACHACMERARGFGHIRLGSLFDLEIAVGVHAADQRGEVTFADRLSDVSRQITNRESDPAPRRRIGLAAMDQ